MNNSQRDELEKKVKEFDKASKIVSETSRILSGCTELNYGWLQEITDFVGCRLDREQAKRVCSMLLPVIAEIREEQIAILNKLE